MQQEFFGKLPDGRDVYLFGLKNRNGIEIKIINFGGIVTSILTPDKFGKSGEIVLGFNKLEDYLSPHPYFGCIVGRFCNRIDNGKFELDGKVYQLAKNDGNNHLHGGVTGFDKVLWDFRIEETGDDERLILYYKSEDGEESYPGNLDVEVCYSLTEQNELIIEYKAVPDSATIVNLTNHTYFNLSGDETILEHILRLYADKYTPIGENLIPTGEVCSVKNSPLDFTIPEIVGKRINADFEQLKFAKGYDHNFVINSYGDNKPVPAAELYDESSGRFLRVETTMPGVQFYSGNFLDGTLKNKNGKIIKKNGGLCFEPQYYPDSPNKLNFPSVIFDKEKPYHQMSKYFFGVK